MRCVEEYQCGTTMYLCSSTRSRARAAAVSLTRVLIEGLTRVFYPELSATVVFIVMAIVLMVRPAGLFGKEK